MSIASPWRMMMLALTIRFCSCRQVPPVQDQDGLAADVFSPQKGY